LRQRDVPTAIDLQDRALRLAREAADRWPALAEIRAVAAIRLSDALMLAGDTHRAIDVVSDAALGRACLVQRCLLAVRLGRVGEVDNLAGELDGVPDDHLAWCRFEQLRMLVHLGSGRFAAAERAARAALGRARAIGDVYEEDRLLAALCEVRQWSPTPMARKLAGCARLAKRFAADRYLLVPVLTAQARCLAYTGDAAGARAALTQARATVELLRLDMGRVLIDQAAGLVCSLDGAYAEAERYYRAAADAVERVGHAPAALTLRVMAVRERARRRPDRGAAAQLAALLERSDEMDMRGRLLGLAAAVRLAALAAQGVPSDGSAVLALLSETDDPCLRGEVYFDLAQAHRHLGHDADAAVLAAAAIESYGSVGATEPERAVRAWM